LLVTPGLQWWKGSLLPGKKSSGDMCAG